MEPKCHNLQQLFGDRYRVTYEESYYAERTKRTVEDLGLMVIPCRNGHVYPHGGDLLAVSTDPGHTQLAGMIRRLECCEVVQDGDHELNATFHADDFDEVAKIMRPHRRVQWTEERRQEQRECLARNLESVEG
jgi:hypothetical protein